MMNDKESPQSGIKRKQNNKDGAKQSIYMFEKSEKGNCPEDLKNLIKQKL